uniref:sensor histidine kinase n=1 Tax=Ningiella ruwaisensis TaxID=2364274 RepID=UPI0010A022B3|nr:PAS domain-containing sensor histidine kinase [Ningiella ruwaisensis]
MLSVDALPVLRIASHIANTPHVFLCWRSNSVLQYLPTDTINDKNGSPQSNKKTSFDALFAAYLEYIDKGSLSPPSIEILSIFWMNPATALLPIFNEQHQSADDIVGFIGFEFKSKNDADNLRQSTQISLLKDMAHMLSKHVQQTRHLRSLTASEAMFKEVARLNKDYMYVKDETGKIIFANAAVLSRFPDDKYSDIVEHKITELFESHSQQSISSIEKEARRIGEHLRVDHVKVEDGRDSILQTLVQRLQINDERTCFLVVSKDVTDREIIINDLKRSNKDLDNFAYVASHDLKAPLNVIKRLISWVIEDCKSLLPQDSLENLELVMNRANRMEQLLQDLLAYSRIGKEYQEACEINVKEKVLELLSLLDLPMGFVLNCDDQTALVPEVPFSVVLLNLISNAIKHHDSGNAKIEIKVRRNQRANVITVIDNGPGIAEEDRKRVFDLFETLKPRDEVEGSGMGLSVVKRLVEHYGGYIKVEENRPRGTKFVVNWPYTNVARDVLAQLSDK